MNEKNQIATATLIGSTKAFILGWGMVFTFVLFNCFGALMIKKEVQQLGAGNFVSLQSAFTFFTAFFSSWLTWLALFSISIATIAWIVALAHLEISKAYPVAIGTNLLIVVGISLLKFQEPLTFAKLLGIFLVFTGMLFIVR